VSERGTTTTPPLLAELARAGIKLKLAGADRLEVSAPRGRLSGELRGRIERDKPELIRWLSGLDAARPPEDEPPAVVHDAANLYEPFAPSDLQMSFLIGSREGVEHHVRPHSYLEFEVGELDPGRLQAALDAELEYQRDNIVVVRDDMRLQTVRDPGQARIQVHDLRGRPEPEQRAHVDRVRAELERKEPPADRWPWLEMRLTLLGEGRGLLHYNNNNLFNDAPGTLRFIQTVLRRYDRPDEPRPPLEIAYRDCVLALADLEESPSGQRSRKYWLDRVPGLPGAPAIPQAAGADPRRRSRLHRRELLFPAAVWGELMARLGARGLTATTALTAVHAEVLAYWSGSRHFLLNNMITHRLPLHPQLKELIGNFASLYPLEVDWRPDEPFHARVRRLQAQVLRDVEHVHWSGVKVLQALNREHGTPGRAVCPFAVGSALFVGRSDRPAHSTLETPQTTLDCEFWELPDGRLWVVWDVIEEMFPDGLIDAMQEGYRSIVTALAHDPAAWETRAFPLLPAGQRERRMELNRFRGGIPVDLLHENLARVAADRPGATAVVAADTALGYGELYRRAAGVAGTLLGAGVRRGGLVAVALPKGWEQVAAVFGVLTAGAAYVPVDPSWPEDRIRYVLADTGARAVLTTGELCGRIGGLTGAPVLPVGADIADAAPADPVLTTRDPTDLAYVIYTSGSTGRPKGAMLDHCGPLNTIRDVNGRFGIGAGDVLFGVSSLCFDLSVYDVFGAVEAGARLVLPPPGPPDPASWLDLVRAQGVTVWNSVPALMQLLVEEAEAAGATLPALRTVLLSGDWIPLDLPDRIRRIAPGAQVVGLGGATEAAIWSIFFPVGEVAPDWVSIPYGRPLSRQTWYVLDACGRDAPIWTAGDLYIGGLGVARGYLNDPARTNAAFVIHPRTGERLYRTGDLGRYLPGGDIEFLGRSDFQVKVQGFRVEPGEIEHALAEHPSVGRAVVVAHRSGSGSRLAAFVTGADGSAAPDAGVLRDALAGRLPAYMVPGRITVLDRLPLTGNGKLDRSALEAAGSAAEPAERAYTAARTATERRLVEVWESVLDTAPIGVEDDFFDLGGQSYTALRVIGQITRRTGRRVPLGVLMERRTIAALARYIDGGGGSWSPLVRLRRDPEHEAPWFFVHPAGGNVLCYESLAAASDRPFHAFQAPGPATGQEPLTGVADLAGLYVRALAEARPDGPYLLGGWSSGAVIAAEMARVLERSGAPVDRLVVVDAPAPVTARPVDDARLLLWFLEDLDVGLNATDDRLRELTARPEDERLDLALGWLADLGAPGTRLDAADLAATFAVFRGVVGGCNAYRCPGIGARVSVVRARDGLVGEFAGHPHAQDPDWGWSSLTTGTVDVTALPGTHHTLLTGASAARVAGVLNDVRPSG
jgi:amino acid adenylation domain-containing protein